MTPPYRSFSIKAALALAVFTLLSTVGCTMRLYSSAELRKKEVFVFPPVYDTIIEPLNSELAPIYKRLFFLKHDVDYLKDKLWDGGSNQRIMKIDDRIDTLKREMYQLQAIRRELLNTIYFIYPGYETPEVVPYIGDRKSYKKTAKPIILVTTQDQREYLNAKQNEDRLSEEIVYKPLIATAMKQYQTLPDSLKRPVQPIGTPGGVPKIPTYTPPPLPRKK
jgi:hypothetical protein